jgi:predicted Ser/Thr protein kinase
MRGEGSARERGASTARPGRREGYGSVRGPYDTTMEPEDPADPPMLPAPSAAGDEPETLVRYSSSGLGPGPRAEPGPPVTRVSGVIVADEPTRASGVYIFGDVLGRGGMGEVVLAHDRRIGRDVAVKRLRSGAPTQDETSRFLREARIQARLDHPAIVPVYELGRDAAGRPYFTMKRLAGTTLADLLAQRTATRQRLLRAFADVCRAVDFAHARGVVHRDLKPGNIVLGEYGEVYVLDWGAARVLGDTPGGVATADIDTLEGAAPAGQVLGTPGYMPPEQLQRPEVGRPADVYALGAILFELLAGEPLHPRAAAIASTLSSQTIASPAARRPERGIAPELDALCTAMLVSAPELRPTARRCAESIEEFLDGDRDLERRRTMAVDLVWQARAAHDAGLRADAMRAASRALALDPDLAGAAELVSRLMLEPPREPSPELRDELRRTDADGTRRHARTAIPGFLLIAAFLPLVIWNGVLRWSLVLGSTGLALVMALAAWRLVRIPDRSQAWMMLYAGGNALLLAALSRLGGSFTFVAALAAFITMLMVTYPAFVRRPYLAIATMLGGFLIPIVLEATGAMRSTWSLVEGAMLLRGDAVRIDGPLAVVSIVLASVATIVMAGVLSAKLARANRDAQHRLVIQAWHLRQVLPAAPAPAAAAAGHVASAR